MAPINNATIEWDEAGKPVSKKFCDIYFSGVEGLAEARHVFLDNSRVPERWLDFGRRRFVVGETGFGTGLNFLALWQCFDSFLKKNASSVVRELHFITFEKFPVRKEDIAKAHRVWPELGSYALELQEKYPIAVEGCHRLILAKGKVTLDIWFADIKEMAHLICLDQGAVDAWFLDGFAPSKNPEMWSQTLFDSIARLGRQHCTCATFTSAGFVRRGLTDAGFSIEKRKGFNKKRNMIHGELVPRRLYRETSPLVMIPASSSLNVAIIGGGVASACLSQSLTSRGIKVTLYCQDKKAAQGASGSLQGTIYPLLIGKNNRLNQIFSCAFLFTRQYIEEIAETLDFEYDWCGVTQLMWDPKSTRKLNRLLQENYHPTLVRKQDVNQTEVNVGLATGLESLYYPLGGWINPIQFTTQIIESLEKQSSLRTFYCAKVTKIERSNKSWQLTVNNNEVIDHPCVVIANGHAFGKLFPTRELPLRQVKGQVSYVPTTPSLRLIRSVLCYDGYLTPKNPRTNTHCIGASYDRLNLDTQFDATAQQENRSRLIKCLPRQHWPSEVDISACDSKQGIRCVSRDHLPFVGNLADFHMLKTPHANSNGRSHRDATGTLSSLPDVYAFLGLGSRGLSTAPFLGEYLASLIAGDPVPLTLDLMESLNPARLWVRRLKKGGSFK